MYINELDDLEYGVKVKMGNGKDVGGDGAVMGR